MVRLFPARLRQEARQLLEKSEAISLVDKKEGSLIFEVAGHQVTYSINPAKDDCVCADFGQKGYCIHYAAVDDALHHYSQWQSVLDDLIQASHDLASVRNTDIGTHLVDQLMAIGATNTGRYHLSVAGEWLPVENEINWSLSLTIENQNSYKVMDIPHFLRAIYYQYEYYHRAHYIPSLRLSHFDRYSQSVIRFLWQILPFEKRDSYAWPQRGRRFQISELAFEEGLSLFSQDPSFSVMFAEESLTSYTVLPLTGSIALYEGIVDDKGDVFEMQVTAKEYRPFYHKRYIYYQGQLYHLSLTQTGIIDCLTEALSSQPGTQTIPITKQDKLKLSQALNLLDSIGHFVRPTQLTVKDFSPVFHFDSPDSHTITVSLVLVFEGEDEVASREALDSLTVSYDLCHYQKIQQVLEETGFRGEFFADKDISSDEVLYQFMTEQFKIFEEMGQVFLTQAVRDLYREEPAQVMLDGNSSWMRVHFDFSDIPSKEVARATEALLAQRSYYRLQNGQMRVFDVENRDLADYLANLETQITSDGDVAIDGLAAISLAKQWRVRRTITLSDDLDQLVRDLSQPFSYPLPKNTVTPVLRPYQSDGVRWLSMLSHHGFGGILADDMGLGKTVQTLAILEEAVKEKKRVLIIAPASLVYNWRDEWRRYTPYEPVLIYGKKADRQLALLEEPQIMITSYTAFRMDKKAYQTMHVDVVILDEAQNIKNDTSQTAQALRQLSVKQAFALTGTPIENYMTDIWSISQVVLPGLFPSKRRFKQMSAEEVARRLSPFILRRKKEDVLEELPSVSHYRLDNELTSSQKTIYLAQLKQMQDSIKGMSAKDVANRRMEILAGLTRLRQICDTPALFMSDYEGSSGKMMQLESLVDDLLASGKRLLIFSQFTQMLDRIAATFTEKGLFYYLLTGKTSAKDRQEMTTAFNGGGHPIFLVSLKAGGVGLNLTGADTVILVDVWWNPSVEEQAIGRAHRMGQTNKVQVYRMITQGTIEEKIQELQDKKRHLVTSVLEGEAVETALSAEDIREMLGVSQGD